VPSARSTLFLVALWTALAAHAADEPAQRAEIVGLQGKGEYRPQSSQDWSAARVKQSLYAKDFVRTLGLSRMEIRFWNGVTQTLDHDGEMQVLGEPGAKDTKCTVTQARSRSWGVARTPPEGFTVCTPSATAGIRGTEWEIAVAADGSSTLAVFNGEVDFYNDQGSVTVRPNEQARAEPGKAPVKLFLRVSRDRVQWANAFTVDAGRYPEFRTNPLLIPISDQLRENQLLEAYARLRGTAARPDAPAAAFLLLADFEVYRGDLDAARRAVQEGATHHPGDERFEVSAARIELFAGNVAEAYRHADAALALRPDSVDALIVRADIDRHEGRGAEAVAGYSRAAEIDAHDARAPYGRGVVESQREDVRAGRADLLAAIALDASDPTYRAELGTLEGFAGRLPEARDELQHALSMQPDNYVALTGLGIVELKAGDSQAAIASFQRATAIEPRYARAHLYVAAAYYQERRDHDALVELDRAAELDPNDPLPHLLKAMIHLDRIEPGAAAEEARAALARVPFLRSVNSVADNQRGIANFGAPLAFMGLEEWARAAAHDSYMPQWGASHLFLSDRYPGDFNRRSELMQGFITDPVVFGASNRFLSLFPEPGNYATLSMNYAHSDDLRLIEPVLTLNGYAASPFPTAYFAEAVDTRVDPGNTALDIRARTYTLGLGAEPVHEVGTFLYATRFPIQADVGQAGVPGIFQHIDGTFSRIDGGVHYAPSPASNFWLKAGGSDQSSTLDQTTQAESNGATFVQASHFTYDPRASDAALRHTYAFSDTAQLDWGLEAARQRTPSFLAQDATFHFVDTTVPGQSVDQSARDRSDQAYADVRVTEGSMKFEAGLGWGQYRKDRDITVEASGQSIQAQEALHRSRAEPFLGVTWHGDANTVRAACRRWLRPASLDTLAPVAVAGMPLDDQLVLAGGTLDQCRAQWEWTPLRDTFAVARAERVRVANLYSPLDGVQNGIADLSNLERLRNRVLTPPPIPDLLEDTPVYASGTVRRGAAAIEQILTPRIGVRADYVYTDSVNDGPVYQGRLVPYLPRHQADFAATWAPGFHAFVTLDATWRSQRFADEANLAPLPPGWDCQVHFFIESADKRWAVQAFGANLLKKEASDTFGVTLSYRF
jgi:Flp pilus assembly protein TadD